jgi:serine/threonine protein kinase
MAGSIVDSDDQEETAPTVSAGETASMSPADCPPRIGRYRVIRRLGQEGFGRVFLAHDGDIDRLVSIKVPNRERISSLEAAESFLAEARSVGQLDHAHIVPAYDVGRNEGGFCCIVSRYIEGGDLAARIKATRPGFRDAAELAALDTKALHQAHIRGLVHRDVKPANILIETTGKSYVADFGLAPKDEDFGGGASFAGTPAYRSPEQARAEGQRVDGRSDAFSLGVVLLFAARRIRSIWSPSPRRCASSDPRRRS